MQIAVSQRLVLRRDSNTKKRDEVPIWKGAAVVSAISSSTGSAELIVLGLVMMSPR